MGFVWIVPVRRRTFMTRSANPLDPVLGPSLSRAWETAPYARPWHSKFFVFCTVGEIHRDPCSELGSLGVKGIGILPLPLI